MHTFFQCKISVLAMCLSLFTLHAIAQEAVTADANKEVENTTAKKAVPATETDSSAKAELKSAASKPPANKKMVQDATISLQTTITGNQEQPKVLYILPWQSPQMADVDFEPLDSQQKAVFNHVERDELRRELETADAIKD
ncbi:MAG TPA: hypothetical protein PK002_01220 [Cellvibrio sp.]|nr:hypothetical protein [Cellvibrio sp.]